MTIDIVSWRSIIGCFCQIKALPGMINKFSLLTAAFKYFIMCFIHIINCTLKTLIRYCCIVVYLVGLFLWCSHFCITVRVHSLISHFMRSHPLMFLCIHQWWSFLLLLMDGDVHPHPGARNLLKMMHWNLNSIIAHDGIRVPLIQSYNLIQNYDLIAITETAINEYTSDEIIQLDGYIPIRKDLPGGTTHGGVMLYHKDSLPVIHRPELETQENSLVCEISINKKNIIVTVTYRRHHHGSETQLNSFINCFKEMCNKITNTKPYCIIHLGDFNAHNTHWFHGDTTDIPGDLLEGIFDDTGLQQLVSEPTHLSVNTATCIDLVVTNQPNLINDCSVKPSLHTTCHHQINHIEININNPPLPHHTRKMWHYNRANVPAINKSISEFDWQSQLNNLSDPNDQVELLTKVLMNIFSNFIPNSDKTVKPSDPPWHSKNIIHAYRVYEKAHKTYKQNGYPECQKDRVQRLKEEYTNVVTDAQENYFKSQGNKLLHANESKTVWSLIKTFLNNAKIPEIPPLYQNNIFVTDFQEKANLFNNFFAKQCTLLDSGSVLPTFRLLTNNLLEDVSFSEDDIKNIIESLNPKKAHGWDEISIRMIKMSTESIIKPLFFIYTNCINKRIFPEKWKKANVIPIHKKDKKNIIKNYRPISLLPIFSKVFEKLIFTSLYSYLMDNNLISDKQSGFIKGDSTINQLLSITHMIQSAFDFDPPKEVRSIYLDISKAFDKVWHSGLIHKLKQNGIQGNMLHILSSFLTNRYQRTTLNGKTSSWSSIEAGVPQGSVLGPLLFLIYINDITDGLKSEVRIFADDTSLFVVVDDPIASYEILNHDIKLIEKWANQWKMSFNPDVSKPPIEIVFSTKNIKPNHPPLFFNGIMVDSVDEHKHIGLTLDKKLTFHSHVKESIKKANKGIGIMRFMSKYVPRSTLETMYKSYVRSQLEYCDVIYHHPPLTGNHLSIYDLNELMTKVESVQYRAALVTTGAWKGTSKEKLYDELGWESLSQRRWIRRMTLFSKVINNKTPAYLKGCLHLRFNREPINFIPRTLNFKASFFPACVDSWNNDNIITPIMRTYNISKMKTSILSKIKPKKKETYDVLDKNGLRHLMQLRLNLNPLNLYKYNHNFRDTQDPMCKVNDGVEDAEHFLLNCHEYTQIRNTLVNNVSKKINADVLAFNPKALVKLLLYGNKRYTNDVNTYILNQTITFIKNSKRFEKANDDVIVI